MPACPEGTFQYQIQGGDTLWSIAQRFHTTVEAIISANPGLNLDILYIGQVICIPAHPMEISAGQEFLSNQLRLLWEQHVFWTRLVILGIVYNLPGTDLVSERLLRNPKDFGQIFKTFYGENAANRFVDLFTSHLVIAAELVKAAKANDSATAADAERKWYANADEIAAFLGSLNPYWSAQAWQKLLYDHLAMTKQEAVDLLTGKIAESIADFDRIENEALEMADAMTNGLVRQFPHYFSR